MANNSTQSNKPVTHTYFVEDIKSALPNSATFQPATTEFINETNAAVTVNTVAYQPGAPMIAPGQIQFYNGDNNQAVAAATNPNTMQTFFIAQGRDTSLDTASLQDRPFEQSEKIPTNARIRLKARLCDMDSNDAAVIGVPNATTGGNINVLDNNSYGLTVAYRGVFAYKLNARNNPAYFPNFVVEGTWTELGIPLVVDQRDYIVQNLAYSVNRASRLWGQLESEPVIALAIKANAGAGVQLSAITVGTVLTIAYKDGNTALPINVTVTNGIWNAIQNAIASGKVLATDRIVIANPLTAGDTTHASAQILLIALDRKIVDTDRVPQVKYRIEVGLSEGFTTGVAVTNHVSDPFEGFGLPRHVELDYQSYAELNKQYRVQAPSGNAFQYPTDIKTYRPYLLVDLEWQVDREASTGAETPETGLITLAIPCCDMELRADWQAFLNGFVGAMPNAFFEGPAAATAKTFNFAAGGTNPCNAAYAAPFKEVPPATV